MTRPLTLIAACASLGLAGCASSGSGDPFAGEATESIEVEVVNLNFNDATLYALRMGQRIRMGVVTGARTETFTVRWATSFPLRIEIRLLGGERCVTDEIPVDPGDRIYLEIPQNLSRSGACIRR
ncbi:MAG: hypothetical protein JSU98_02145 [Gemmatimonadales bacterium]|jgi:hypothetical protein|nr:MAG: hypothetical protein JSU98_02145 [Gemmatimonadales bacterium]